jgi:hypothetical protein
MRIKQSDVPIELRRKAAQHLESIRGTEMSLGAERAQLSDEVCPIFRPDLDGVAYYEFQVNLRLAVPQRVITTPGLVTFTGQAVRLVVQPRISAKTQSEEISEPSTNLSSIMGLPRAADRGFIIVSAADHDFPIAHWSLESEPISQQLEAAAKESDKKVARVFKLDVLAYVAEDDAGEKVAQVGQLPVHIKGLPSDLRDMQGMIASASTKLHPKLESDREAENAKHSIEKGGPAPPYLELLDPGDWVGLKERYTDVFRPFLEDLKRRAAPLWEIDRLVSEFGEGIVVGEPHRVALLQQEAVAELSGEASGIVNLRVIEGGGAPPALELYVAKSPFDHEADVELHITYPDGVEEHLRFFVVSRDMPSNVKAESEESLSEDSEELE